WQLWRLARDADPAVLSPAVVAALAELMGRRGLDPSRVLLLAQSAHPIDFRITFALGQWFGTQDVDEAVGPYRAALALRPDHTTVLNNLGVVLYMKGDRDGAIRAFEKAIEIKPKDAWTWYNLGVALYMKGDRDGAIRAFEKAIEINPQFVEAWT